MNDIDDIKRENKLLRAGFVQALKTHIQDNGLMVYEAINEYRDANNTEGEGI